MGCHGVHGRRVADGCDRQQPQHPRGHHCRHHLRDRLWPRTSPLKEHHPPRHQVRQHSARQQWRCQTHRLWVLCQDHRGPRQALHHGRHPVLDGPRGGQAEGLWRKG
eukprot:Lithocolla_globosa_v1_NODE_7927_length_886_cov_5.316486.p2 type:complete len:107 gc:universal NODE_7927_length_886_cov_5.316486:579-259(-)